MISDPVGVCRDFIPSTSTTSPTGIRRRPRVHRRGFCGCWFRSRSRWRRFRARRRSSRPSPARGVMSTPCTSSLLKTRWGDRRHPEIARSLGLTAASRDAKLQDAGPSPVSRVSGSCINLPRTRPSKPSRRRTSPRARCGGTIEPGAIRWARSCGRISGSSNRLRPSRTGRWRNFRHLQRAEDDPDHRVVRGHRLPVEGRLAAAARGAAAPEVHGEGAPRDAPPAHLDPPEDSRAPKREALVSCVPSWADARSFGVATQGSWSPFGLPTVNEASLRPHRCRINLYPSSPSV